jgi:hypothetical protein
METREYVSSESFNWEFEENGESEPDLVPTKPKLVAEREIETRVERLNELWGYANGTVGSLSNKYQRLWNGAITELADYKGTLYVTWRDELSRLMFEGIILGAWEDNGEHVHSYRLAQKD